MKDLFIEDGNEPFILFSITHLLTLLAVIAVCIAMYIFRKQLRKEMTNRIVRYSLAAILLFSEISLNWWLVHIDDWSIQYSLPLHLSSLSLLLSSLLLIVKRKKLFEFTYFVGLGSAIQAMITPDLQEYTFPHFRYVHFFISHGGIVVANMFMVLVEGFRPTFKSIFKALVYLNGYALFLFILNYLIKGNYMYIMNKPVNPSILDYLGPWPFYIIPLEIIAFFTFVILYTPFYLIYGSVKRAS